MPFRLIHYYSSVATYIRMQFPTLFSFFFLEIYQFLSDPVFLGITAGEERKYGAAGTSAVQLSHAHLFKVR